MELKSLRSTATGLVYIGREIVSVQAYSQFISTN